MPASTANKTLSVTASGVAELPLFGTTTVCHGFFFEGYGVRRDLPSFPTRRSSDLTLSGIPPGWTVKDGATLLGNGQAFAAADLGLLVVTAPDQSGRADV